ncbi:hypothetical protein CFII68_02865 [Pseudomonas sp. CFII68]|nr:hypothetical protein CFII68_02865 [Pseudomonas sp. CFII68]
MAQRDIRAMPMRLLLQPLGQAGRCRVESVGERAHAASRA